jgi:hypothetical protein
MPFGLNHRNKPSDQAQQEAYKGKVGRPDAQEHEWNPEHKENQTLDTVEAKKQALLMATSADQVEQRKQHSEQIANPSAWEGFGTILFFALAVHKAQAHCSRQWGSGRVTGNSSVTLQ